MVPSLPELILNLKSETSFAMRSELIKTLTFHVFNRLNRFKREIKQMRVDWLPLK